VIAFISDIHANRPALQAVLDDIDSLGTVERIYCLGDVVGYGPDVEWCLDAVTASCKLLLMGNHEHAVLHGAIGFHAGAKRAIDWTRTQIEEITPSAKRKATQGLLASLPLRHEIDDILLVHGSPRDPVMEYVLESDLWEGSDPRKIDAVFAGFQRLCFVGHTHRPGVFTTDRCFLAAGELPDGYDVSDNSQYLINVGSVGQPRDRDPRACYTLFSGDAVYFRRVAYNIDAVAARVRAISELDPRFADRLYRGE
jgi:diadenosine tetraphosphatase ApaH/serine/threonine PP2A family protein phosphatase